MVMSVGCRLVRKQNIERNGVEEVCDEWCDEKIFEEIDAIFGATDGCLMWLHKGSIFCGISREDFG